MHTQHNMKKLFITLTILYLFLPFPALIHAIDRTQYRAIDPFDYRLDEDRAARGAIRKFASVVRFESAHNSRNTTIFNFTSLDGRTSLDARVTGRMNQPESGQIVTIYYTGTKRVADTRILDDIDLTNTSESGIGVVQSPVAAQTDFNRALYEEIDPFDYKMDVVFIGEGEIRKYWSTMQFSSQDGTVYFFASLDPEQSTRLRMRAARRFPPMTEGQRVTVYFTAEMGFLDALTIDYITN